MSELSDNSEYSDNYELSEYSDNCKLSDNSDKSELSEYSEYSASSRLEETGSHVSAGNFFQEWNFLEAIPIFGSYWKFLEAVGKKWKDQDEYIFIFLGAYAGKNWKEWKKIVKIDLFCGENTKK